MRKLWKCRWQVLRHHFFWFYCGFCSGLSPLFWFFENVDSSWTRLYEGGLIKAFFVESVFWIHIKLHGSKGTWKLFLYSFAHNLDRTLNRLTIDFRARPNWKHAKTLSEYYQACPRDWFHNVPFETWLKRKCSVQKTKICHLYKWRACWVFFVGSLIKIRDSILWILKKLFLRLIFSYIFYRKLKEIYSVQIRSGPTLVQL